MRCLSILLLLAGCGAVPQLASSPSLPSGWPSSTDCDAALWAGEARLAGDSSVDMRLSIRPAGAPDVGRPTRRPGADCGPTSEGLQGAPATTSTDMLLGTIAGLWAQHSLSGLESLQSYADSHHGIMGSPSATPADLAYTWMKPGTRALLSQAIESLGGKATGYWADLPQFYDPASSDYQVHLAFLSAELQARMGTLTPLDRAELDMACQHQLSDALVQAVCGNIPLATALIENPMYKCPPYVRGASEQSTASYCSVHKAFVKSILSREGI